MPSQHPNSFQASQRELLGRLRGARTTGRPAIEPPRLKRGNYCPARFSVSTKQPQLYFMVCCMLPFLTAGVAESVDAPDSKSGEGNLVWVRVPPPAQSSSRGHTRSHSEGGQELSNMLGHHWVSRKRTGR